MRVIITGGAGFIGKRLTDALIEKGYQITVFDPHPPTSGVAFVQVDLAGQELPAELFQNVDAIIHLAGRNIFARWNQQVKKQIYDSRIVGTRGLVKSLGKLSRKPEVFISGLRDNFPRDF